MTSALQQLASACPFGIEPLALRSGTLSFGGRCCWRSEHAARFASGVEHTSTIFALKIFALVDCRSNTPDAALNLVAALDPALQGGLEVGAAATLSELIKALQADEAATPDAAWNRMAAHLLRIAGAHPWILASMSARH